MSFLRKDPFGAAWVLISPERGLGPADFAGLDEADGAADRAVDRAVLAPGREAELPAEIGALRPSGAPAGGAGGRGRRRSPRRERPLFVLRRARLRDRGAGADRERERGLRGVRPVRRQDAFRDLGDAARPP